MLVIERYLIRDADTGRRLAAAADALSADDKALAYERRGHSVAIETVAVTPPAPAAPAAPAPKKRRRQRERRPMRFYDLEGQTLCRDCRDNALTNAWRVASWIDPSGARRLEVSDEPPRRPRSFAALGERPWAGNEESERYIQCDGCNGQWGPDA